MTHGPVGDSTSGLDYEETEHPGRVVRIASVAALGGLLFGYDSAVINGAVISEQQATERRNRRDPDYAAGMLGFFVIQSGGAITDGSVGHLKTFRSVA